MTPLVVVLLSIVVGLCLIAMVVDAVHERAKDREHELRMAGLDPFRERGGPRA